MKRIEIRPDHPLRKLFKKALEFGTKVNPVSRHDTIEYIEKEILLEFIHSDNLFKIRDASGRALEDIAEMLAEGEILLNAQSFDREFQVHKHIGDYTLFMLGMFPSALGRKRGKEFVLGKIIIPDGSLSDHYLLQGKRSYRIASEFGNRDLFQELSINFQLYRRILELVRVYLESIRDDAYLRAKRIITGNA